MLGKASASKVGVRCAGERSGLHIDQVYERSDVAVALADSTGTLTIRAANSTITVGSRELFVLRRTGTDWQITDYMFNRPGSS